MVWEPKNGIGTKNQKQYQNQERRMVWEPRLVSEPRKVPEPRTKNGIGTKNGTGTKNQEQCSVPQGIYRESALVLVQFTQISEIERWSSDCGASRAIL